MSISKFVDNRAYSTPETYTCQSVDCMFNVNGACSAEWCIFNELPAITTSSRTVTCSICGEATKSFSLMSGTTSYICSKCQEKIKKVTPDEKPCSVCSSNMVATDEYICKECQEKIAKTIKDTSCPICGSSINPGEYICKTCANKIKEKLNE